MQNKKVSQTQRQPNHEYQNERNVRRLICVDYDSVECFMKRNETVIRMRRQQDTEMKS